MKSTPACSSTSCCANHYRLSFKLKPSSISRRTASERVGLSGCFCAQSSTRAINSLGARIGSTGAMPVAGRPRFFVARKLFLTLTIFRIRKLQADGKLALATGPNPSHGGAPMAQAERINTAIRELMSHGRPLKPTSLVRTAHTEFVAALPGNAPRPIRSENDWEALEARADHLQKVFAALHVYLTAIVTEIADKIPAST